MVVKTYLGSLIIPLRILIITYIQSFSGFIFQYVKNYSYKKNHTKITHASRVSVFKSILPFNTKLICKGNK